MANKELIAAKAMVMLALDKGLGAARAVEMARTELAKQMLTNEKLMQELAEQAEAVKSTYAAVKAELDASTDFEGGHK